MTPHTRDSLPVSCVAAGVSLVVLVIGAGILVASYNDAHHPRHSDSWDGPLSEMPTCAGPVEDWTRGVREHRARTSDATSASTKSGFVTRFVMVVVPWHLERRPLLPLLIVCCEICVLIGACRLWIMELNGRKHYDRFT